MTDDVDRHIGRRLRQRRWMLGLTQSQVGDRVGIKFQQIQKYETGQNRVSASRLWDLAAALHVTPSYFFDGLEAEDDDAGDETIADRETVELARAVGALPAGARAKLLDFLRALTAAALEAPDRSGAAPSAEPRSAPAPRGAGPRRVRREAG